MEKDTYELACEVSDAWLAYTKNLDDFEKRDAFGRTLERLELRTRPSPLRKVRP